ncbi:MAG: alpha/beta hydrolase, partial [Alphaproteobacteria bacterium]|nr:alpha/beta hydrolase [Alphaproteobacteria bacterium]
FILIPEWLASPTAAKPEGDHWISRWERNFATAAWLRSDCADAAHALIRQSGEGLRPIIVVTHGQAVDVLLAAGEALGRCPVIGAFIVAPAPKEMTAPPATAPGRLAFPSVVIAPDDHPEYQPADAQILADRIGGHFVAAGLTGRLDPCTGHGPWPEGMMRLGWFLKQLKQH